MASDIILNDDDVEIVGRGVRLKADESREQQLSLDSVHGNIWLGGDKQDGDLVLMDGDGVQRVHLDATRGRIDDNVRVYLGGGDGTIQIGGEGQSGDLLIKDDERKRKIGVQTSKRALTGLFEGWTMHESDLNFYSPDGTEIAVLGTTNPSGDAGNDASYLAFNDSQGRNLVRIGVSPGADQTRPYLKIQDANGNIVLEYFQGKLRSTDIYVEGINRSLVTKIEELERRIRELEAD